MTAKEKADELFAQMLDYSKLAQCNFIKNDYSINEQRLLHIAAIAGEETGQPLSMSDVTEKMQINKSTASQLINKLEDAGLVERYSTRQDRRMVFVRLTEQGQALHRDVLEEARGFFRFVIDRMGEQDSEVFLQLFHKYNNIITEYNNFLSEDREHA